MAAHIGRRLRRGAATTAVAAVAMAALTASQAPGLVSPENERTPAGSPADDLPIDGGSPYHTDLPPLRTPDKPGTSTRLPGVKDPASGIPATVLDAYRQAEAALAVSNPGCNLPWELLAAIGKVESGHARGGAVDAEGTTLTPIRGPQLNGDGFARIADTDGGTYDGDTSFDRAVGPMQFIPSTWMRWSADGNGDGAKDPNNIYDAALAAGRYLCAGGRDLADPGDLERAILGYNPSREYLNTVLTWLESYRKGTHEVPDGTGVLPTTPGAGSGAGSGGKGSGSGVTPGTGGTGPGGKEATAPSGRDGKPGEPGRPGTPDRPADPDRPTVSASGTVRPGGGSPTGTSPSPSAPETTEPGDGPGEGETTPPAECPTDSASPSPSPSDGSGSPAPSASPSASPSGSGSPTTSPGDDPEEPEDGAEDPGDPDDPCGDRDAEDGDGKDGEDGDGKDTVAEPAAAPTAGSLIGTALARLTSA
ncbi:lytic transglycosylase domain-containing protein [Streptomyces zingiberis]|uniref:Transglycosylase SLT domain-containing protein n=1 Tax=Streptomyces zingiberis TaxID=2053010 RepID=A0ABX1C0I0_9ACTN|nr:lytic transglycosylase domain-containing protein [Streptomyces zingiberis]NJQ02195.1 hypothetical protein [Streptomyces zingiberis]